MGALSLPALLLERVAFADEALELGLDLGPADVAGLGEQGRQLTADLIGGRDDLLHVGHVLLIRALFAAARAGSSGEDDDQEEGREHEHKPTDADHRSG